jgi:hypothetical protein
MSSARKSSVSRSAATGIAEVLAVFPSSCSRVATTRAFGAMSISERM